MLLREGKARESYNWEAMADKILVLWSKWKERGRSRRERYREGRIENLRDEEKETKNEK